MDLVDFTLKAEVKPLVKIGLVVFIDGQHNVVRIVGLNDADVTAVELT